ncbi:transmembrane protein 265-like [Brachyistius frenatus]|uniref:transmembrane protein 265-like n=1 Tax=Brachyistius frenatus TaxID=100188 RepID=UPI0037E735D8
MSNSPQKPGSEHEEVPLTQISGSADSHHNNSSNHNVIVPKEGADEDHRTLAICSIICGISCVGVKALIYSVKAEERRGKDPEKAAEFSKRARKFSIISIVTCASLLVSVPLLFVLISYLLTLID